MKDEESRQDQSGYVAQPEQTEQPVMSGESKSEAVILEDTIRPHQDTRQDTPKAKPSEHASTGGMLVLQWLAYAFWFWLIVSVGWLSAVVADYYRSSGATSNYEDWGVMLAYPLAATVITLLIVFVTDLIYSKHEPAKKIGGANVIMLLHVVPFVLMSIGAMIVTVFLVINMMLETGSTSNNLSVLVPSIVVMIMAALAATRIFFGSRSKLRLILWIVSFGVIATGFVVAGIVGPMANAIVTRDDRLIARALPNLASNISEYASKNNKLPETLNDVEYRPGSSGEAVQAMIDRDLVAYKPNTNPTNSSTPYPTSEDSLYRIYRPTGENRVYYQLCVTYKNEKKDRYNYRTNDTSAGVSASYSLSIDGHPKGEVCYDLYATVTTARTNSPVEEDDTRGVTILPMSPNSSEL